MDKSLDRAISITPNSHLRSPAVHQPDPDPYALRSFAIGRHTELFPPYDLPGAQIFADFCADLVRRWQLTTQICPHQVLQLGYGSVVINCA